MPEVKEALKKPNKERIKIFKTFKRRGIRFLNLEEIKKDQPNLKRERKPRVYSEWETMKMCGLCFGFFEGRYISRHQNICKINSSKIITLL